MPAPREERKNGCPSSLLLSHTLLKGRIKHSSELAATQSERASERAVGQSAATAWGCDRADWKGESNKRSGKTPQRSASEKAQEDGKKGNTCRIQPCLGQAPLKDGF